MATKKIKAPAGLFTEYKGTIYQNRLAEGATLIARKMTFPSIEKITVIYCVFKTVADLNADAAIATGFPTGRGSPVEVPGMRTSNNQFTNFYINSAGSLCAGQSIPANTWCQCSAVYLTG
jgi:hypothetical protein